MNVEAECDAEVSLLQRFAPVSRPPRPPKVSALTMSPGTGRERVPAGGPVLDRVDDRPAAPRNHGDDLARALAALAPPTTGEVSAMLANANLHQALPVSEHGPLLPVAISGRQELLDLLY